MRDFLARYYELDQLKKLIEAELEKMKRVLIETFPEPIEQRYDRYLLKIYMQDRGAFDLKTIFPLLPTDELRLFISNPNNSNIKELIKAGTLSADLANEAYHSKPVPVISLKETV